MISGAIDILDSLAKLSGSSFTEAAYVAQKTIDYTHALEQHQISKPEFDDLMADLRIDQMVATTTDQIAAKAALRSLVASLLPILEAAFPAL